MRAAVLALALALGLSGAARAEVKDLQPNGFQTSRTIHFAAPPEKVYEALIHPERWWNSSHTWSGSAANLRLEPRAGGCWCERLPRTGGEVQHLRAVFVDPAGTLRFEGALGPLQSSGAVGHMTWAFAAKDGGTDLTWTYDIGGYFKGGFASIAPAVDQVQGEQAARLKKLVETGKPD
jgi:uncharacterized protein YndB with AHSA1/START domain